MEHILRQDIKFIMGQKLAAYDAQGNITAYYDTADSPPPAGVSVIEITDEQWQMCLSAPGYTVEDGALVAPPAPTASELLVAAQAAQIAVVKAACQAAIIAGFTSAALGDEHTYPSTDTDQRNLLSAATASQGQSSSWTTVLWCASGSPLAWAFTSHTAAQVQQVSADFLAFRIAAQQKYADLVTKINAATSVSDVQAITWVNPQ
ncbi:DUF4376 domain-containing protein [Burkholderia multivorans]|uniref:DUF4376 domain-containing protein n=1 Tax=Burkholderia multivorans TaxID=87883 RepID=UPI001C2241B1|nr:hypothetical protein [Burkholderia multivorans]MBU9246360.1 hypothetical protein [Burkholderia multivorans]